MKILVNASNLKVGGGLQVAESLCGLLPNFDKHIFYIVLSDRLKHIRLCMSEYGNINIVEYTQHLSLYNIVTGQDKILDDLISKHKIDAVLTVFGPSRWKPKCFHLCGFAMPHIVLPESPYWELLSPIAYLKLKLRVQLMKRDFRINNDMLWCENEYISQRLRKLFKNKRVETVTNNYNQIFDYPEQWDRSIKLPSFNGITLLTITANYPHKNISIALPALDEIKKIAPELNVRFVFTINRDQYPTVPDKYKENIIFLGPVAINQCPPLYEQADIMFQPSLLECFSAMYAEAMKMELPILATDLGFAHSLCGNAAVYYKATDPKELAKGIVRITSNKDVVKEIVSNGIIQLGRFDTFKERADKLIKILENNI